jgi:hypothetical protein
MDSRVTSAVTIFALLVMAALFGLPQPATACTCAAGAPVELLEASDLAFIGSVVDQQPDFAGTSTESLIAVHEVVKGEVATSIIVTGESDSACGLGLAASEQIAVTAVQVSGEILPKVCTSMEPDQLLAAADELGLEVVIPLSEEEMATALPESTSNYAAAIPLSIALSLVFLGAVALGTRQSSMSSK